MTRIERALGILLLLSDRASITAAELARRFEVSVRTIYRDVEALGALGVPVYAERGAAGGYRLIEGYFLPPVAFSRGEAVALLLALTLVRSLQVTPLSADLETAERKLLNVLPHRLRPLLAEARRLIGFERPAGDAFHQGPAGPPSADTDEARTVDCFLRAVLDGVRIRFDYRKSARAEPSRRDADPMGLLWDRDHWYLVARLVDEERPRLWRADRVLDIAATTIAVAPDPEFDVRRLLDRAWLAAAMDDWARANPVRIRLGRRQVERLMVDWYYRHARFDWTGEDEAVMTLGESDPADLLGLLRWLGPGAELLEPKPWRRLIRAELETMLAAYAAD